ncbi:MAG: crossover junction endodeoxyribonuclease RuvC [Bacteroidaceae bacterium]|nr:crossover junction endodeoxyribonuclease RuvC [Bacteroidaceae bacterium]
MATEKIILGVDPGTTVMGYGVLRVVERKVEVVTLGVIDLRKIKDMYLRLGKILERMNSIIEGYKPDEMAIESPFLEKNVQTMLKLGRAQGIAIAAAIHHQVPITEYAPMKIKMAITGQGGASKEQVRGMLVRILHLDEAALPQFLDATDGLAAAYCHYLQLLAPMNSARQYKSWKDFALKNSAKIHGGE